MSDWNPGYVVGGKTSTAGERLGETGPLRQVAGQAPWEPDLFPSVRCVWHFAVLWGKTELMLNTSYAGGFFKSRSTWEDGVY